MADGKCDHLGSVITSTEMRGVKRGGCRLRMGWTVRPFEPAGSNPDHEQTQSCPKGSFSWKISGQPVHGAHTKGADATASMPCHLLFHEGRATVAFLNAKRPPNHLHLGPSGSHYTPDSFHATIDRTSKSIVWGSIGLVGLRSGSGLFALVPQIDRLKGAPLREQKPLVDVSVLRALFRGLSCCCVRRTN